MYYQILVRKKRELVILMSIMSCVLLQSTQELIYYADPVSGFKEVDWSIQISNEIKHKSAMKMLKS